MPGVPASVSKATTSPTARCRASSTARSPRSQRSTSAAAWSPRGGRAGYAPAGCPRRRRALPRAALRQGAGQRRRDCRWVRRRGSVVRPRGEDRDHDRSHSDRWPLDPFRNLDHPTHGAWSNDETMRRQSAGRRDDTIDAQGEPVDGFSHTPPDERSRAKHHPEGTGYGTEPMATMTLRTGHDERSRRPIPGHDLNRPDSATPVPGTVPRHGQGKAPQNPSPPQQGEPRSSPQRGPRLTPFVSARLVPFTLRR